MGAVVSGSLHATLATDPHNDSTCASLHQQRRIERKQSPNADEAQEAINRESEVAAPSVTLLSCLLLPSTGIITSRGIDFGHISMCVFIISGDKIPLSDERNVLVDFPLPSPQEGGTYRGL